MSGAGVGDQLLSNINVQIERVHFKGASNTVTLVDSDF